MNYKKTFLVLFISLVAQSTQAQLIFKNSFEASLSLGSEILNTTATPGGNIRISDDILVTADSNAPIQVTVTEAIDDQGKAGFFIEITGGRATIQTSEEVIWDENISSRIVAEKRGNGYLIDKTWFHVEAVLASTFPSFFIDIRYARPPKDGMGENANNFHVWLDDKKSRVAELKSNCASTDTTCLNTGVPVLLIHGYQVELATQLGLFPNINNNGGQGYWDAFPEKLRAELNLDALQIILFEFKWLTNSRYQDVALDLARALEEIYQRTGNKKVHIIAHSFGGLVVRSLLEAFDIVTQEAARDAANRIASITTIGSPHSGIFGECTSAHGEDFAVGRDLQSFFGFGIPFCNQLSCQQAGEKTVRSLTAEVFKVNETPGEVIATFSKSPGILSDIGNFPDLGIQTLIGFTELQDKGQTPVQSYVGLGDGLISGPGQRFLPQLAKQQNGDCLERSLLEVNSPRWIGSWESRLQCKPYGNSLVTERILGRVSDSNSDTEIQPNIPINSSSFNSFIHSKGITAPLNINIGVVLINTAVTEEKVEPFVSKENISNYHDAVQRSADWILQHHMNTAEEICNISTGNNPKKLNDTGIVFCGNSSSNSLPCPVIDYPGQDAQYGRDATHNNDNDGHAGFSFTKLDENGNALPSSALKWTCVKDNVTGLIWEVKTDDGGLQDKDNTYTWYSTDTLINGGSVGVENGGTCSGSLCDTQSYTQEINAFGLCGENSWRMPTFLELATLVNYNRMNPSIDINYFPKTINSNSSVYWSSSPYFDESTNNLVRTMSFSNGSDGSVFKFGKRFVRLVLSVD